jgi:hypothetical protein
MRTIINILNDKFTAVQRAGSFNIELGSSYLKKHSNPDDLAQ